MGILRFILAISVVLAHSSSIFGVSLVGGKVAVLAFYIISGFYMALVLNKKYVGKNNSYRLFITNRLLRLFPIYWTVLILTVVVSILASVYTNGNNMGSLQYYWEYFSSMSLGSFLFLIFTNLLLVFQDWVMFMGLDTTTGALFFTPEWYSTKPMLFRFLIVPQAWTIGVEITFYLIAPFIARKNWTLICILIFASILLRVILFSRGLEGDPWSYRFFPTVAFFFLFGIIGFRIYEQLLTKSIEKIYLKIIFGFIVGFTACYSFLPFTGKEFVYLLLVFLCVPFVFLLSRDWKIDRYIGELSYPIYISHIFMLMVFKFLGLPKLGGGRGLVLVIITIGFSVLLNEFVSKKVEIIRQRKLATVANK